MKSSSAKDKPASASSPQPTTKAEQPPTREEEIRQLREENTRYARYIREKTNQLLQVMGTQSLKPEEFDDRELLSLDPIGIIAGAFEQVLEHLNDTIAELSEARDELQAIFDATGVGISIIDRDFCIVKCNEKQRELLVDSSIEEVAGRYCYNVYCNRDNPGLDCPALESFTTGRPVTVREVKKKDKYFQVISTPFAIDADGEVTRVIEVALDITDKKLAELEQERQRGYYLTEKLKFATVIESLSEGLLVTDASNRIVSANTAAGKITGQDQQQMLGADLFSLLPVAADQLGGKDLQQGENVEHLEITHAGGEGDRILAINAVLLKDAETTPIGRVLTIRDITEEKQRRAALFRAEKLAAVGQLSAGLAHELNTPLGSILGYARLLLRQDNFTDQQRDRLNLIAQQAKKSSAIIQGLLNFARVSSTTTKAGEAGCYPGQVIAEANKVLAAEFEQRGITVNTRLDEDEAVAIDAKQLEQVIVNMLLNSMQAMKATGGTITITTDVRGNRLQLSIIDDGPGIPQEVQSRIFDPFFTTKEVGEGTGLGLSICSGIINEFGGAIDVDSEEGHGTTFTITLPLEKKS